MKKILVATVKPFASVAKREIEAAVEAVKDEYTLEFLEKYPDQDALCAAVADADAMIVRSDIVDAAVLDAAENLKVVVRAGAGYDNLDLETMKAKGVFAMNTPGQNANGVAEMVISMLIFMSRNAFTPGTGSEIAGKVLGLHGFGAVARLAGQKASALGMQVMAFDPFVTPEQMREAGVIPAASLEELYSSCYAVSIHVPALPSTIGCVNADLLEKFATGAGAPQGCPECCTSRRVLINTARAEIIDDNAMFDALAAHPQLRYISDVAKAEKWGRFADAYGARVWANAQKSGGQTEESNTRCASAAARRIIDFFAGVQQKGLY